MIRSIEIEAPRQRPGYTAIPDFYMVRVTLHDNRMEQWDVILPLPEILAALGTLQITDSSIKVQHPAFPDAHTS